MAKDAFIRARTDSALKAKAEAVLSDLGLNMSQAITLFLTQVIQLNALPFEVKVPNAETRQAIADLEAGIDVTTYDTLEELFASWDEIAEEVKREASDAR